MERREGQKETAGHLQRGEKRKKSREIREARGEGGAEGTAGLKVFPCCVPTVSIPPCWTLLCQLPHDHHHALAQERRGRACLQRLRALHEAARGKSSLWEGVHGTRLGLGSSHNSVLSWRCFSCCPFGYSSPQSCLMFLPACWVFIAY